METNSITDKDAIYQLLCPDCGVGCTQDHNSFSCHYCCKLWPKGYGWERFKDQEPAGGAR